MQSPDCLFFWINMKRPACNTSHLVMACISTIFIYLSKIYISWKFAQSRDSEGLDNICSVFYSAHWPCKLQIAKRYNLEGGEIPYLLLEGLERLAYVNFWATLLNVWGEVYLKMASEDNWISERGRTRAIQVSSWVSDMSMLCCCHQADWKQHEIHCTAYVKNLWQKRTFGGSRRCCFGFLIPSLSRDVSALRLRDARSRDLTLAPLLSHVKTFECR